LFLAHLGEPFVHVLQQRMRPSPEALAAHSGGFSKTGIDLLSRAAAQSAQEATRPTGAINAADASPAFDPLGAYPIIPALTLSFETLRSRYALYEARLLEQDIPAPNAAAAERKPSL
jgi:hypothetical protein